ncbi:hypothetical protein O77CONTIG1_00680 [Leptolyngbya sp. O-77]|nr:hypothetical protein O77CONTIG1_00680 [Leptolyngbya sp. O-77]
MMQGVLLPKFSKAWRKANAFLSILSSNEKPDVSVKSNTSNLDQPKLAETTLTTRKLLSKS